MALQNQRVVVMGGTSGIGLATARAARALGAEVIVTGRDEQKLRSADRPSRLGAQPVSRRGPDRVT
jgi:NAD(P)-dependent dehydrogenase (short-subunit alcohol dehydrogenase family)